MAPSARNSVDQDHREPEPLLQTSSPHSLSQAVFARKAEYVRPRKIKIKIGTWNVAACAGTEKDLAGWFAPGKGKSVDKNPAGMKIKDPEVPGNLEGVKAQEQGHTPGESAVAQADNGAVAEGEDDIGIYVLGLQEVVEISAKEYLGMVYADSGQIPKWKGALADAIPSGYVCVVEQQLSGLLLLVFASPEIAPTVSSVSTMSVGTGIMGYLGNKGAIATRIILGGITRLVFVNCHLAAGTDPGQLERRCWDVSQVLQRTQFDPIDWAGVSDDKRESIGDEDFAFWFGDLNFRLDGLPGDDIRRLLMLHTKENDIEREPWNKVDEVSTNDEGLIVIKAVDSEDESEVESPQRESSTFENADDTSSVTLPDPDEFPEDPSQDPTSLQAIIDSLLPHDQLRRVQKTKKALQEGWREGPITFLPTYKYDIGSMGVFDSSEKKRAPSWCDRILFRTRRDKLEYDETFKAAELARRKDEEMKARGIESARDDEDVLFDYNPEEDGAEEGIVEDPETAKDFFEEYDEGEDAEDAILKEDFVDKIHLDAYTTHQGVLSSDHKPMNAVFTLEYDAVAPELKSRIQAEVARELDRAENEGRPGITVVVDHSLDVEQVSHAESQHPSTGATEGVNFGPVSLYKRVRRIVTIANTSQVNSTFVFLERPDESGKNERIAPPWLSVCFDGSDLNEDSKYSKGMKREVTLEPGDTINVFLELFISDLSSAKSLNDGLRLDDVLVLRVTDGRDHFIPVRGSWLQTCFGRSVDELIRVPEGGVRSLPPREGKVGGIINGDLKVCWSAPRELFKLTEAIESLTERCVADVNMREDAQSPKEIPNWPFEEKSWQLKDGHKREAQKFAVIDALDWDKDPINAFSPEVTAIEKIEILAEVLVLWLGSLTDGLITSDLWIQLENDMNSRGTKQISSVEEIKTWVLDVLSSSPNHNISFVFLTSTLKRVAAEFAPLPKIGWKQSVGLGGLETVRRSLNWRGTGQYVLNEKEILRRQAKEKAYADVFSHAVFRGPALAKDKEKRAVNDRRKYILEAFLHGYADADAK